MRSIKYRVFFKGEMYYLASSQMSDLYLNINNEHWGLFSGNKRTSICTDRNGHLMQFTGWKDIKGVDIYEGDILENDDNQIFTVSFKDGCFTDVKSAARYAPTYSFIIGNIHQNKELIKVGEG